MNPTEWIGMVAAILTTIAFMPQAVQVLKTRSVKDISLPMYTILALGVTLWLVYGLLLVKWPIILANAFTLIPVLIILYLKLKYKK